MKLRLVFMGTPEAAVPTLGRCVEDGHAVVAVWTQPDRAAGRGNKLTSPPVKDYALAHGIPVNQPSKIKTDEARELFASHDADVAVIVAYGRILPSSFLSTPRRGCVNVHFSLLPKYRGAAPVNWAIVRGERETGVTTMLIDEGLDTGAILRQRATQIEEDETAPHLLTRLSVMGAELLSETLKDIDGIEPRHQNEDEATLAPMLRREDGRVDWTRSAIEIERRVRGFQPWPNVYAEYDSRRLVIWRAEAVELSRFSSTQGAADGVANGTTNLRVPIGGEVIAVEAEGLVVACGEGSALRLLEVQVEGKRRTNARDFSNGARLHVGERLL
ncbi:MAG: methionyl-tRNA formyltransferase [Acidobacteriota bacterium]|nr:methionyl-tRNA formyltransferase [Acidobacteriota bacterium]